MKVRVELSTFSDDCELLLPYDLFEEADIDIDLPVEVVMGTSKGKKVLIIKQN